MSPDPKEVPGDEPERAITVPGTIEDLRNVADAFLSTGWTLAAAVWAWTYEGLPGGRKPTGWNHPVARYSISEFADLRIRGLLNRPEIRRYRAIWQSAIDAGLATAVEPGETVTEPDAPFGLIEKEQPGKQASPSTSRGGSGTSKPRKTPAGPNEVWDDSKSTGPGDDWTPAEPEVNTDDLFHPADHTVSLPELGSKRQQKFIERATWSASEVDEPYRTQMLRMIVGLREIAENKDPGRNFIHVLDAFAELSALLPKKGL